MAGRQMRWTLGLELFWYVMLGLWLQGRGWSPGDTLLLAVVLALGFRALVVMMSYGFLLRYSSPVPAALRVGPAGAIRMVLEEYIGLILLFTVIQPFEHFWLAPDRLSPNAKHLPLLLLHGYQCNRGFWFWLRPRLEAAGWTVATHNLEPVLADIDSYAAGVERRIAEILSATGCGQVILVGHSMGGLVARAYLRRYGSTKVARMISLGSPHHGSRLAALGWGRNGKQMRIGNPWLAELAKLALPADSASIYSVHDNQVVPQCEASELRGAKNIAIGGVSHLGMAFSPAVLRALLAELG